jgi:hypothetical protein
MINNLEEFTAKPDKQVDKLEKAADKLSIQLFQLHEILKCIRATVGSIK